MYRGHTIATITPVLNEAASIGKVIADIPEWVDDIIVVDNGSRDDTAAVAAACGARVLHAARRGYGSACLVGIANLKNPDIVVFVDGDYSDHPEEMARLIDPIIDGYVDMMIGSRVLGKHEPGALTPQAAFGNWLATKLIRLFWGVRYTDLGPFRAIRHRTLLELEMADPDYGWTVEMQIKAALHGVPADEAPVRYRKRIGVSKVSGTVRGVIGAGYKILGTIFVSALLARRVRHTGTLCVFTRYPVAGEAKTRLIPALGPEGAADLQRQMTAHTVEAAPPDDNGVRVEIRFDGGDHAQMRDWLGPRLSYTPQGEGNLGDKMLRAVVENFIQGSGAVVHVGTDCPGLTCAHTTAAFAALKDHDLVIGPAEDGGYYLIGLRIQPVQTNLAALFRGVAWGTETVREQTCANAEEIGLSVAFLDPLPDVDRPEDIAHWEEAQRNNRLAVVIPAINEATHIQQAITAALQASNVEVIVVDGGSTDGTAALAEAAGARVIPGASSRARQMNLGARATDAACLLFLHADTLLPRCYAARVRRVLADPDPVVGAFQLDFDSPGRRHAIIAWGTRMRCRLFKLPYGDQALFMRRNTFEARGGFQEIPIMEDYAFVKDTPRVRMVDAAVVTSARRFRRRGILRVSLFNTLVIVLYRCGVKPDTLAKLYGVRSGGGPR